MTELSDHRRDRYLGTYASEEHHGHLGPISVVEPIEEPRNFQGTLRLNDRHETKSEWIPPVDEIHDGCRDEPKRVRVREIKDGDDVEYVLLDAVELSRVYRTKQLREFV